ncbi:MAG: hypothetical protein EBZ51_06440 [Synechococcaceae bacterium WB9_2_112]|nr:hypothetical protein [Synechococcaceae bacterium WB9_2_112]
MPLNTLCGRLGPTLLLAAGLAAMAPSQAQDMLEGCQLVNGTLQCVPGITADPQQQIRDLRQQIGADQKLEAAVEQQITGLQQLVLQGQAAEGGLLQATLAADALASLPPSAFHWYRLKPGSQRWVLIQQASGPSYRLTNADVNARVMVVVAVPSNGGSQRQASAPLGPVTAAP